MNIAAGPHHAKKNRGGCFKFLLIAGLTCLILSAIGGLIVYWNYKAITAWMVSNRTDVYLDESAMQDQHKQTVRNQRDRILEAFENGILDDEKLKESAIAIYDEPIFPGFVALLITADLAPKTGMTIDDQAVLECQLSRLTRASTEKKLSGKEYQGVIEAIIVYDKRSVPGINPDVSAEDLLKLRTAVQLKADELGIPDEIYVFDFDTALREFVDSMLGERVL